MTRADGIVDEAEVAKKVGGLTGPEGRQDVPTTTMQLTSDVADDDDEDDDVVVIDVLKKNPGEWNLGFASTNFWRNDSAIRTLGTSQPTNVGHQRELCHHL